MRRLQSEPTPPGQSSMLTRPCALAWAQNAFGTAALASLTCERASATATRKARVTEPPGAPEWTRSGNGRPWVEHGGRSRRWVQGFRVNTSGLELRVLGELRRVEMPTLDRTRAGLEVLRAIETISGNRKENCTQTAAGLSSNSSHSLA